MVGVVKTNAFLITEIDTVLATGQANAAITPDRHRQLMEDLNATLFARSGGVAGGGSFVRVTDPEFGADPTGVADSTAAFQAAAAAGPCLVPALQSDGTTGAIYKVANCVVPNGAAFFAETPRGYGGGGISSDVNMHPQISVPSGAALGFNIDSTHGVSFRGMRMTGPGTGTTTDCLSPGCASLYVKDCLIANFRNGIGGPAVGGSTATFPTYESELHMSNSIIQNCTTGIGNLVDSWIEGSSITSNINGWSGVATKCFLTHSRIEWNGNLFTGGTGSGLVLSCNGLVITTCHFDANGNSGLALTGNDVSITGCLFTENGGNVTSGTTLITTSAHIQFNGVVRVTITGSTTYVDNQTGAYSPAHFASFTGTNNGIAIIGNNLSGYQGSTAGATKLGPVTSNTTWFTGSLPTGTGGLNGIIVKSNFGTGTAAQDVDTR